MDEFDGESAPFDTHGIDLRRLSDVSVHTVHRFPPGRMWTPRSLEINGRKGRRMICVLAEDKLHYRQFDVDSPDAVHNTTSGGDGTEDLDATMSSVD